MKEINESDKNKSDKPHKTHKPKEGQESPKFSERKPKMKDRERPARNKNFSSEKPPIEHVEDLKPFERVPKHPKDKKALPKLSAPALQEAILDLFRKNPKQQFSARQIIEKLDISNNRDAVTHAIEQLEASGRLHTVQKQQAQQDEPQGKRPRIKQKDNIPDTFRDNALERKRKDKKGSGTGKMMEGIVDMTKSGSAFIVCEGVEEDIFIHNRNMNSAMNGDKVQLELRPPKGRRQEGIITKVLERAHEQLIGIFRQTRKFHVVVPDKMGAPEVRVSENDTLNAQEGEKVVVKITSWGSGDEPILRGVITTILGAPGTRDIDMKSILIDNGFNIVFPSEVLEQANEISAEISETEISKRRDFRNITTFTIDPEDAKDFDDALSFKVLGNGHIEVGVHIADVAHYLKPNTPLDKEAYLRATSVYLVDRVCPMLPERLSNNLCSLRPREEKLTFSAVFEFSDVGEGKYKIVNRWFGKTIINSNRRFTYEEAQKVLETQEGQFADELAKLNEIALYLRKKRFKDGAVNFETDEVRFRLDDTGAPVEAYIKARKEAHLLIEDFMLLANREVSAYVSKKEKLEIPFIYRTHDLPNMEKLEEFALFAREMGVKINLDTPKKIAASINSLMLKTESDPRLKLLAPIAIRCMAKAEYSTTNIGHYGLSFEHYSHFTSPIRRYSDVIAHRILEDNLDKITRHDKERLDAECKHISKQERKAAECERESTKYYQVEYLKSRVGIVFEGQISGMVDRGIFVELRDNRCEGLISFDRLGEPFEVAPNRLTARGLKTGKVYRMGDALKVRILSANLEKRQIEMDIVLQ
jgi:ribonuclease R